MAETYQCPVEGCDHAPFKTPQARQSHIRNIHPDYEKGREEAREVPIVEEDFAKLLKKFKIKGDLAYNIAENISHTGGPRVFEDPELLLKRLVRWSSDITPGKRTLIIEQWFAEKNIDIPVKVKEKAGMTTEQIEKTEAETKATGEPRYVWDTDTHQIRMAKEGERGGTLAQAKELKKMAEEDELGGKEPAFVLGEGNTWTLNPKGKIGFGEFAVFQMYQDSLKKGEPIDPVEELARREEASVRLKEAMGVKAGGQDSEMTMLDKLEKLGMLKKGEGGEGALLAQLDALGLLKKTGGGEGGEGELLTKLDSLGLLRKSGGTEGDSAIKEALIEMRKSMDEMKEERWRDQFTGQQKQIQEVASVVTKLVDKLSEVEKGRTGRTEMDIIHEVATEGLGFLKTELPGVRRDIKEALGSVSLPPGKTPEDREKRKQKFKQAVDADREIEEIGRRLFFTEG